MLHEKRKSGSLLLVGGIILAAWCIAQIANAAEPFMLTSPAFKDGTPMQKKNANNTAAQRHMSQQALIGRYGNKAW